MVKQQPVLLGGSGWVANNVDNWNKLRVGACNCVDSGKFAYAKGCDDCGDAFYTCIAISGISGVQLVAVSNPVEPGRLDVVKSYEIVISWKAVN